MRILVASVVAGIVALLVAVGAAGAGHGSYLPAKLLFPFTMLLTGISHHIGPSGMLLAIVQFPVYGAILNRATVSGMGRVAKLGCGCTHGVVAALALMFADPAFAP